MPRGRPKLPPELRKVPGKPENFNPIDVHVGLRIRLRRKVLGWSQEILAEKLALTFQQVQKYERGHNRVGASRLYDISKILNVPIGFFFEDMPLSVQEKSPRKIAGLAEDNEDKRFTASPLNKLDTMDLVRFYYRIRDPQMRELAFQLLKMIAEDKGEKNSN